MAKCINQTKISDAKLKIANFNANGQYYAFNYNADGFSKLTITNLQQVDALIQGSDQVVEFSIFDNVSKVVNDFHASYPNLTTFNIYNENELVEISDNAFSGYPSGQLTIYVADTLLQDYIATYPNLTFASYITAETFVLPTSKEGVMANPILETTYLAESINDLPSGRKAIITKLIIPTYFTNANALWSYDFSALPLLNDNIMYKCMSFFSFIELSGTGTLASEDIDNLLAIVPSAKKSLIKEIHFNGYTDNSVALSYDYSALTSLEFLWLDNVKYIYDTEQEQWVISAYFYPLADYLTLLGTHTETEIAYFDYNGTAPDMSDFADFDYAWCKDSKRTQVVSQMENGCRYYLLLKPKNGVLTISGSGTLTSDIVAKNVKMISGSENNVNQVIFNSSFSSYANEDIITPLYDACSNLHKFRFLQSKVGVPYSNWTNKYKEGDEVFAEYIGESNVVCNSIASSKTTKAIYHIINYNSIGLWFTVNSYYLSADIYFEGRFASFEDRSFEGYGDASRIWVKTNALPSIGTNIQSIRDIATTKLYVPSTFMNDLLLNDNWVFYSTRNKIVVVLNHIKDNDDIPSYEGYTLNWYSNKERSIVVSLTTSSDTGEYYGVLTKIV